MEGKKAQIVKCRCGSIFAACVEPHCYTEPDWQKDVRKYAKQGYRIEMKDCGEGIQFSKCKCYETQQTSIHKSTQISIFN